MKKLLAFGLASAMALSMASAAIAATDAVNKVGAIESTPYAYDTDKAAVDLTNPNPGFAYGDTLYYPLLSDTGLGNAEALNTAREALNAAQDAKAEADKAVVAAQTDSNAKTEALKAAEANLAKAQDVLDAANAWNEAVQAGNAGDTEQAAYSAALTAYNAELSAAADAVNAVLESDALVNADETKVEAAKAEADAAAIALTNATTAANAAQTVVNEKQKAYDDVAAKAFTYVYEYDAVRGIKVKQNWDMNGKLVKNVEIVKKKVVSNSELSQKFIYFVAINLNSSTSTSSNDLTGTIEMRKSGEFDYEERQLEVATEIKFPLATQGIITPDLQLFKEGEGFSGDSEDELRFEADEDSYFTVNTIGQGKLLLSMDTKFDTEIAARFPSANLDFFNGNGASFNKTGTMTLSADEGSYLYKVNKDGSLSRINASYDEYDEAFTFKTRSLERYVISDTELKNTGAPVVDGENNNGDSNNGNSNNGGNVTVVPSNPSTGASI